MIYFRQQNSTCLVAFWHKGPDLSKNAEIWFCFMIRWAVGNVRRLQDIIFRAVLWRYNYTALHYTHTYTRDSQPICVQNQTNAQWDDIVLLLELHSHGCPPTRKIISHYGWSMHLAGVCGFRDVQGSFWRFLLPPSSLSLMVYERAKKRLSPLICLAKWLFVP